MAGVWRCSLIKLLSNTKSLIHIVSYYPLGMTMLITTTSLKIISTTSTNLKNKVKSV